MRIDRISLALGAVNLALLATLLVQGRPAAAADEVLRGRSLEIVDADGRVRASIGLVRAGLAEPEVVLLRLIDGSGQPSVKISTSGASSGMSLVGGDDESYVLIEAAGPRPQLKLSGPQGRARTLTP